MYDEGDCDDMSIEYEMLFLINNYVLCEDECLTGGAQKLKYFVKEQIKQTIDSVRSGEYLDTKNGEVRLL